jgi:hypothetical protein
MTAKRITRKPWNRKIRHELKLAERRRLYRLRVERSS